MTGPVFRPLLGDVLDGCDAVSSGSVAACVGSPPYFERDGWSPDLCRATGRLLARVLAPGSHAWIVVGSVAEAPDRPKDAKRLVIEGGAGALEAAQDVLWVKSISLDDRPVRGHVTPIRGDRLLNWSHESVLHVVRGPWADSRPLDRLAVGVGYADLGNLKRGTRGKNGNRRCRGDAWHVPYSTTGKARKKAHEHGYPVELARRLLLLSGLAPGEWVLDPFVGGGATAVAAHLLGLSCAGVDIDRSALEVAVREWESRRPERGQQMDLGLGSAGSVAPIAPAATGTREAGAPSVWVRG